MEQLVVVPRGAVLQNWSGDLFAACGSLGALTLELLG